MADTNDSPTPPEETPPPASTRRLFFAIHLSEEVCAEISALSERLRKGSAFTGARPKFVGPENFHITLWFLGDTEESIADKLLAGLRGVARGCRAFDLDVRHLGYFPNAGAPRVLWVGTTQTPPGLVLLRERIGDLIERSGLPLPKQEFHPHVTLARLKGSPHLHSFVKMATNYRHHQCGKCTVSTVELMESHTEPGGARYERIASARLGE